MLLMGGGVRIRDFLLLLLYFMYNYDVCFVMFPLLLSFKYTCVFYGNGDYVVTELIIMVFIKRKPTRK